MWESIVSTFGTLFQWLIIMVVAFTVLIIVYVRIVTRGKMMAFFHEKRSFWSTMLKVDRENECLWLGRESSENREKYMIDENKMFTVQWPGFPSYLSFLTIPMRALEYVKGKSEPFDPEKHQSKYGSTFLRLVTDVNMLKSQWRDVRESLGLGAKGLGANKWLLFGLIAIGAVAVIGVVLQMQNQKVLHDIFNLLHGVTGE